MSLRISSTRNSDKNFCFFWHVSRQAEVKSQLVYGKFEVKGRGDMADYLIEFAQQARLLNLSLENKEFLDLTIHHYPQDVRNALIVARAANFGETVTLLKQLQG